VCFQADQRVARPKYFMQDGHSFLDSPKTRLSAHLPDFTLPVIHQLSEAKRYILGHSSNGEPAVLTPAVNRQAESRSQLIDSAQVLTSVTEVLNQANLALSCLATHRAVARSVLAHMCRHQHQTSALALPGKPRQVWGAGGRAVSGQGASTLAYTCIEHAAVLPQRLER
jgi:hypothetical protein